MNLFPKVLPVSEFRAAATRLIKDVVATPGQRVYVGANRRPEAVLMAVSTDTPPQIREKLLETYFIHIAEGTKTWAEDGKLTHVGDGFGSMFSWLWETNEDEALHYLAVYIRRLNVDIHTPAPQSLDDVLVAMRLAADITDTQHAAICERARVELAARFPVVPLA